MTRRRGWRFRSLVPGAHLAAGDSSWVPRKAQGAFLRYVSLVAVGSLTGTESLHLGCLAALEKPWEGPQAPAGSLPAPYQCHWARGQQTRPQKPGSRPQQLPTT